MCLNEHQSMRYFYTLVNIALLLLACVPTQVVFAQVAAAKSVVHLTTNPEKTLPHRTLTYTDWNTLPDAQTCTSNARKDSTAPSSYRTSTCITNHWIGSVTSRVSNENSCNGKDGCWLDDACLDYTDCCYNYFDLCKVPTVTNILPTSISTEDALTRPLTIIGGNFGTNTNPNRIFDIAMNGHFYYRRNNHDSERWFNAELVTHAPTDYLDICGANVTVEVVNEYGIPARKRQLATFSFNPPQITAISADKGPTMGNQSITLTGSSFGFPDSLNMTRVTVNGVEGAVKRKNHTELVFHTPPGSGRNLPILIHYCGQVSNAYLFRYEAPVLSTLSPTGDLIAGQTLTLTGANYGSVATLISVTIGSRACTNVKLVESHTRVTCTVPVGCCTQQGVVVTVDGQASNTLYTSYAPPVITSLLPGNGPTTGGTTVVLTGRGFYQNTNDGSRLTAVMGSTLCDAGTGSVPGECGTVTWTDTRIQLQVPPSEGTLTVSLNVGDQLSNYVSFAYDRPVITGHFPATLSTSGGQAVTFTGLNFGFSARATIGGRTCTTVSRVAHTQLVCNAPVLGGVNIPVLVSVAGTLSATYYINATQPAITSVQLDDEPAVTDMKTHLRSNTGGGRLLRLTGSNFGAEPKVYIGAQECFYQSRSHTAISCTVAEGSGANLPIVVNAGGQSSRQDGFMLDFLSPTIDAVFPNNGPTSGGSGITVSGDNFGRSGSVVVGGLPCPTFSHTHTQVICTLPSGVGVDLPVAITVASQAATRPNAFTYASPAIMSVIPLAGATTGGYIITVVGFSFGSTGSLTFRPPCPLDGNCPAAIPVCAGPTNAATGVTWTHTQITCPVPAGVGSGYALTITRSDAQTGTSVDTFAYNVPAITSYSPSSVATAGGTLVTVVGSNFGPNGAAKVSLNGQIITPVNNTHTQVIFAAPMGYGTGIPLSVHAGALTAEPTYFAYSDPAITALSPANLPTVGHTASNPAILTITGRSFTSSAGIVSVTVGSLPCPVVGVTHTQVTCQLPAGGGTRLVRVIVSPPGMLPQQSNQYAYTYAPPTVTAVAFNGDTSYAFSTAGGQIITVLGQNFGAGEPIVQISGRVCAGIPPDNDPAGPTAVRVNAAHTAIRCRAPEVNGLGQNVLVTVSGVSVSRPLYNTAAPSLATVTWDTSDPDARSTEGGTILTLDGANFGTLATVSIAGQNCPVGTRSHTRLTCQLAMGAGTDLPVTVTLLTQTSNALLFSYAPPVVDDFEPKSYATPGGGIVRIRGRNFGPPGAGAVLGTRVCITLGWTHTEVNCTIPAGQGTNLKVGIYRWGKITYGSETLFFNYHPPAITAIAPRAATAGGSSVTITGTNLGLLTADTAVNSVILSLPSPADPAVVSPTPCPITYHVHTQIVCTVPAGYGTGIPFTVSVAGQSASSPPDTPAALLNYLPPSLVSASPTRGSTSGGTLVTLTGSNFGSRADTVLLRTGGGELAVTGADIVSWLHSSIVFRMPAGSGTGIQLGVRSAAQASTATTVLFSYNAPTITSLYPASLPTGGGDRVLTLSGESLALAGTIHVGAYACVPVPGKWTHTSVECTMPTGRGLSLTVTLTTSAGTSNALLFCFDAPTITALTPTQPPTSATVSGQPVVLTIAGSSFSEAVAGVYSATVTVGGYECPVLTQTHAEITCTLPAGIGAADVVVAVAGRASLPFGYAYGLPTVSSVVPGNGPTSGGTLLTLHGENFGASTSAIVTVGGVECQLALDDTLAPRVTHTELVCVLPEGDDVLKDVSVGVGAHSASCSGCFSYDTPTVTSIAIANEPTRTTVVDGATYTVLSGDTRGGYSLTLQGASFGAASGLTITIGDASCLITSSSHTQAICTVTEGVGTHHPILLLSRTNAATYPNGPFLFSYDPPSVSSVTPTELAVAGGTTVTVQGVNFGLIYSATTLFTIRDIECRINPGSYAHTHFTCVTAAGMGDGPSVALTVAGQTYTHTPTNSADAVFLSYAAPIVNSHTPATLPSSGGAITLYGQHFGLDLSTTSVAVLKNGVVVGSCLGDTSLWTDNRLVCTLPPGFGSIALRVSVTHPTYASSGPATVQRVSVPLSWTYEPPVITALSPGLIPVAGQPITLTGTSLGALPAKTVVTIAGKLPCSVTEATHTTIVCNAPPYYNLGHSITVVIDGIAATVPARLLLGYLPPILTAVAPGTAVGIDSGNCVADATNTKVSECPVVIDGKEVFVVVRGSNLYIADGFTPEVYIGSTRCRTVLPLSDDKHYDGYLCSLPSLQSGYSLSVSATVGTQRSNTLEAALSYAGPKVQSISLDAGVDGDIHLDSVFGGTSLTLAGVDFGRAASPDDIRVYVGNPSEDRQCAIGNAASVSCSSGSCIVVCTLPPNVGAFHHVTVAVSTIPGLVQYTAPSTHTITYPAPVIRPATLALALDSPAAVVSGDSTQGQEVFFEAHNTLLDASRVRVYYQGTDTINGNRFFNISCNDVKLLDRGQASQAITTVSCITNANPGYNGPFTFQLWVANQDSTGTDQYTYPSPPIISKVRGCSSPDDNDPATYDCPTSGVTLTISGQRFTPSSLEVRVGSANCMVTQLTVTSADDASLECTIPGGSGVGVGVTLYSLYYAPTAKLVSFASPGITGISSPQCTQAGPTILTNCPRAAASGKDHTSFLAIASDDDSDAAVTSIAAVTPAAFQDGPVAAAADTSASITITGSNFGLSGATVYVGDVYITAVTHDPVIPSERIFFTLPAGFGLAKDVLVIQRGGGTAAGATISYTPCPTGTFESYDAPTCTPCPAGSFSNTPGVFACTPCAPGSFQAAQGRSACDKCAIGSANRLSGRTEPCEPCMAGYFAATEGLVECTSCAAGAFSAADGATACTMCAPGKYTPTYTAAVTCTNCAAGRYSYAEGSLTCLTCPAGTFTASTGSAACTPCPTGTVQPSEGQTACVACASGFYMDASSQTQCLPCNSGDASSLAPPLGTLGSNPDRVIACAQCPAGAHSIKANPSNPFAAGPTQCSACPAGKYSANAGQQGCLDCPQGRYSGQSNRAECDECETGRYATATGQSTCLQCEAGHYSAVTGAIVCLACNVGSYSVGKGNTHCQLCSTGKYQSLTAQSSCTECAAGMFAGTSGQAACLACTSGTFAPTRGLSACVACGVGKYSVKSPSTTAGPTTCTDCDAGTFASTTGQASCAACTTGYVAGTTGSSSCVACTGGKYADVLGLTACKDCSAGSFSGESAAVCTLCPPGQYKPQDASACTPCPSGTYSTAWGSIECQQCSRGTYQDAKGQSSCRSCPSGRYADMMGLSVCTACAAGRYQESTGQTQCNACVAGTFASLTAQSRCFDCPKGTYTPADGLATCLACPLGTFANNEGTSTCSECSRGKYGPQTGLSECVECIAGTYNDLPAQSACAACPVGKAQSLLGQDQCENCPTGHFSAVPGLRTCVSCAAGKYQSTTGQSTCVACPRGHANLATGQAQCTPCLEGTFATEQGSLRCSDCPLGHYQSSPGSSSCVACAPGTHQSQAGMTTCDDCAEGYMQPQRGQALCTACASGKYQALPAAVACVDCDPGTYSLQVAGQGITQCTACPSGQQQPSYGQPACLLCPAGTYYDAPSASCFECAVGTFQPNAGMSSCVPCAPGTYAPQKGSLSCLSCPPGSYTDASQQSACLNCEIGKYQDMPGKSTCENCVAGYVATQAGMAACLACPIGTYEDSRTRCLDCMEGHYQPHTAATACLSCPAGKYTFATAQVACVDCIPGTFSADTGSVACTPCPQGRYASVAGLTDCVDCAAGHYNPNTGAFSCLACVLGKYQDLEGETTCVSCEAGMYNGAMGQTTCVNCERGKYATATGLSACIDCTTGYYSDTERASECKPCELGTYQNQRGQTSCLACSSGKYTDATASIQCVNCIPGFVAEAPEAHTCTECRGGFVQPNAGQATCVPCIAGKYIRLEGQTQCLPCGSGTFSDEAGATGCNDCEAGSYSIQTGTNGPTECVECSEGKYQAIKGQERCLECESGRYSDKTGLTNCVDCEPGKFAYRSGETTCVKCPTGRFSNSNRTIECSSCPVGTFASVEGSSQCTECPPGSYQNAAGNSACLQCPPGTYQPIAGASTCIPCPIGQYAAGLGNKQCVACARGHFARSTGSSECAECPLGYFQASKGQGYCNPCQPGTFTPTTAALRCSECPVGTSQSMSGGTQCEPCPPGSYMDQQGQARCLSCAAGTYSDTYGAQQCTPCVAGQFQATQGSTSCINCSAGSYSSGGAVACKICDSGMANAVPGSPTCVLCDPVVSQPDTFSVECHCLPGYYLPDYSEASPFPPGEGYVTNTNDFKCAECPRGADCSGIGNKWSSLRAQYGWWRATNETDVFYRCLMPSYCPGGTAASAEFSETSGAECVESRSGVLCQSCIAGYRTNIGGACEPCPDNAGNWVVLIIFFIFVIFIVLLAVYTLFAAADDQLRLTVNAEDVDASDSTDSSSEEEEEEEEDAAQHNDKNAATDTTAHGPRPSSNNDDDAAPTPLTGLFDVPDPYSPSHMARVLPGPPPPPPNFTYKLKIFISFLQIATNISNNLEIQWPNTFKAIVLFFDFANFDEFIGVITASECYEVLNYYTKYAATVIMPLIAVAALTIMWIIPHAMRLCCFTDLTPTQRLRWEVRYWILLLFFLFTVYPAVSSTVLNHYVCKRISDSVDTYEFLIVDLRVSCSTDKWLTYAYIGIPFILLYPVGIPLLIGTVLYLHRHSLQEPHVKAKFGFLYHGYEVHAFWWDLADTLHKFFLTCLLSFFPQEAQLPVALVVAGLYLMSLLFWEPYLRQEDDVLALVCQNLILLLLLAGYFFYRKDDVVLTQLEDVGMTIALLIAACIFLGLFLAVAIHTLKQIAALLFHKFCKSGRGKAEERAQIEMATVDGSQEAEDSAWTPSDTEDSGSGSGSGSEDEIEAAEPDMVALEAGHV